ncbi:uncharacterized protein ACIQIH_013430 [Cyanocitta cristata]
MHQSAGLSLFAFCIEHKSIATGKLCGLSVRAQLTVSARLTPSWPPAPRLASAWLGLARLGHRRPAPPDRTAPCAPAGERPAPGRAAPELPRARPGTRGRGGTPCGRDRGGGAPGAVPRGDPAAPGWERAARRQRGAPPCPARVPAGGRPFPRAGRGSSLRSPAAPRSLIDYFLTGTRHRSLHPPLPPGAPLHLREGAGAGPGAEERRRLERSGGAARFEPRQRHLSSTELNSVR